MGSSNGMMSALLKIAAFGSSFTFTRLPCGSCRRRRSFKSLTEDAGHQIQQPQVGPDYADDTFEVNRLGL